MIFGSNADEGGLFALRTYISPVISPENYTIFLYKNFGTAVSLVAQQ
jgi:hypothetical protein